MVDFKAIVAKQRRQQEAAAASFNPTAEEMARGQAIGRDGGEPVTNGTDAPQTALPVGPVTDAPQFARAIIRESWDVGHGGEVPADIIHDLAVKHGLLIKTAFDPKKHENTTEWDVEPGEDWYVFADLLMGVAEGSGEAASVQDQIARLTRINGELVEALEEVTAELSEYASITVNCEADRRLTGMVERARAALKQATEDK